MELKTLLQVLYENGQENLIALAVKIDNNINTELPKEIAVRVHKNDLPEGKKFESSSYGTVMCEVISCNQYKVNDNYLVRLPNGKMKYVSDSERSNTLSEIIDDAPKEELAASPSRHPSNA